MNTKQPANIGAFILLGSNLISEVLKSLGQSSQDAGLVL